MKTVLLLLLLYSCESATRRQETSKKVNFINSTILERSRQNPSSVKKVDFSLLDHGLTGHLVGKRQFIYDSTLQIYQIIDWYRRDSLEEVYGAYFINNQVSLVTLVYRNGKKASGYATYHVDGSTIIRKDESGKEIDTLELYIKRLNQDAANFIQKRKNKS